ncbi:threonine aldolase family protein [Vibrio maerlii]|uniref:threonine aldolase family protein n=1 Tax=Vibrio maerlii TaxID=2231648 RepID=UPI000E3D736B|nr:beta-eliminating lyase-related protein [Vibrio maerlii]
MSISMKQKCEHFLCGQSALQPADEFAMMAEFCHKHSIEHDTYGSGEFLQQFEQKVAELLGYEAGVFVVSGTMAQVVALNIASERSAKPLAAMHPTCHIIKHEWQNYQFDSKFIALPVGHQNRVYGSADLKAYPGQIDAALYELPMREIGGQLPTWDELQEVKTYCRQQNIHLHLDGARLWEASEHYFAQGDAQNYADVTQGFDSTYVSFYKGIGGLAGAMLLGNEAFINKAKVKIRQQGGDIYHRTPLVVSAAMRFDERLTAMNGYHIRAKKIAGLIEEHSPSIAINPKKVQVNLFHVHLPMEVKEAEQLREHIADRYNLWLANGFQPAQLAGQCYFECYVGENSMALDDELISNVFSEIESWIQAKH